MNQELANSVKSLVPPCHNAIKAIAGERECPTCKGKTHKEMVELAMKSIKKREGADFKLVYTKERKTIIPECQNCNGTGKVGWKWELEQGDFVIGGKHNWLWLVVVKRADYIRFQRVYKGDWVHTTKIIKGFIPILHWEKIEDILEGAGYEILIGYKTEGAYFCWIVGGKRADAWGKTRQEAVMLAVIELRKEVK